MSEVKKTDKWRDLGDVGGVGIEFVVSIAVGYWIGHWLDTKYFGSKGYATFIGASLGIFTAFKAIYDAAKRMRKRLEELDREDHERSDRDR